MPVVSAESVPRPEAPGPTSPTVPQDYYQNIPSSPESFGALQATALQGAGGQLRQVGDEFAATAIARQQLHNQISAHDAANGVQDTANKILYGDPSDPTGAPGYYGLKGKNALDATPGTRQQLIGTYAQARANLQNPLQQLAYDNEVRHVLNYQLAKMGDHYDQQQNAFAAETNKATYDLGKQGAAAAASVGDSAAFDAQVGNMMKGAIREVQRLGGGQEQMDAKLGQVRADATVMQVQSLIPRNPTAARALLEEGKQEGLIPLNTYDELDRQVRSRAMHAQAFADVFGTGGQGAGAGGALDPGAADASQRMAATLKSRGYSDAAITGALNNALGESSLNPQATGAAGERGYFQFSPSSHLGPFTAAYKDWSPEAQANYVADVLDKDMPDYKKSTDSAAATRQFLTGFEKPKDQSDTAIAARVANTATSLRLVSGGGGPTAAAGVPPGTIDETKQAGFGTKFGPLQPVQGMIIHHTAGGESVDDVIKTFQKTGYPSQFIIDRQGKIYQTLPDGYQGQHIRDSYGPLGAGKTNANMEGVEIIANNDGDVLPAQQEAAAKLVAMRAAKFGYNPQTSVFGHGEVNPGHKEVDEGMSTVTRIRNGSLDVSPGSVQMAAAAPADTVTPAPGSPAVQTAAAPGAAPIPAGAAPPAQLPSMADGLARIARGPGDPDQKALDMELYKTWYTALYTDNERQRTQRVEAIKAEDERTRDQYYKGLFPTGDPANVPTVTSAAIANAPLMTAETGPIKGGLTAETKQILIGLAERENRPDPLKGVSERNSLDLFRRIHLGDGDPQKITDTGPIDQARIDGKLTRPDMEALRKEVTDVKTAEGERLSTKKADFIKGFEHQIDKSNPLLGTIDESGGEQLYKFKSDIDAKIAEYQQAKKDPFLLFRPGSPDYLGKPENIEQYKVPLQTSIQRVPQSLGMQPTAAAPSPVVKPPIDQVIPLLPPKTAGARLGIPSLIPSEPSAAAPLPPPGQIAPQPPSVPLR